MAALTPMMQQYMEVKNQYKDCILFYRLGDFYEMFFDDALTASKVLEITLTGRDCGQPERAPMCGVPYHACDVYLNKLIENGFKVAICEQVEDPKLAKGIVKREVIRVVTPGTNMSNAILDETRNNYLMSIVENDGAFGISLVDITTGEFKTARVPSLSKLTDEINKYSPAEIIGNHSFMNCDLDFIYLREKMKISISEAPEHYFNQMLCEDAIMRQFGVNNMDGLGLKDFPDCILSSGVLLQYLHETQKNFLAHINHIVLYSIDDYMILDSATRRNLELCETLRDKQKRGSLLWVLDKTKTAMGARMLRSMIEQPLIYKKDIEARLDAVEQLNNDMINRDEMREYLNPIYDLERLMTRISLRSANPRDMIAFKTSLSYLPYIRQLLQIYPNGLLADIYEKMDELQDIYDLLERSINDDPPILIREGGIFKDGYLEEIDTLKSAKTDGKTWLAELEEREKQKTGIKNLRIKFNKVFGYYFEVTNSYKDLVPEYFIRKQTLANSERYTTEELDNLAGSILGSEDKLYALEYETYVALRDKIAGEILRVQNTARQIALLDCLCSLSYVASANQFVRPEINEDGIIDIKEGRHPVVEKMMNNGMFISNDTYLNNFESRISIITGPNMAGKSALLRQTALIVIMAQAGCFVPAASAKIGYVDKIFTRVGASDNISQGESTFMVEMNEAANILNNISDRSLVLFDELGRGTSTYDGISIAWAIVEYLHEHPKYHAKTLFATHYHELNEMEHSFKKIKNYNVSVKEVAHKVIFLRKLVKGGSNHSFGIQVGKMAGLPQSVIKRADEILKQLENDRDKNGTIQKNVESIASAREGLQLSFFQLDDPVLSQIRDEIAGLDINGLTPLEALNKLSEIKKIILG